MLFPTPYPTGSVSTLDKDIKVEDETEFTASGANDSALAETALDLVTLAEEDKAINVNPGYEDLLAILNQTAIDDTLGERTHSKRTSLVIPRRPTLSPLQRRNAVRSSSGSSAGSPTGEEKRLSIGVAPLSVDRSRRLSAPAHPGRSISDPVFPGDLYVSATTAKPLQPHSPHSRARSVSDLPPPRARSASPSNVGSASYHLLSSSPSVGYGESEFIPLPLPLPPGRKTTQDASTIPPPKSTSSVLNMPTPMFAVQAATPLTPVPLHRERFDNALVEANRKRMSDQLLAQRKERRKSWTSGDTNHADSNSGFRCEAKGKEKTRESDNVEDTPLEDWEKELRQIDAEQKMRNLEGSRRRSMEFKDWERRQRSEIVRRSLLGKMGTMQ